MEIILSGIGMGIVLSFLTGPVFFALIKTSIEKGLYAGMALAAGVVLSDGIFVALSLFGSTYITKGSAYIDYIGYAGAGILLSIGVFYLLKKVKLEYEENTSKTKKLG
jgi:threonine/homoserine/homoserine lactone efflux protein